MQNRHRTRYSPIPWFAAALAAIVAAGAVPLRAQESVGRIRSLIEQALDEPCGFSLSDKTLNEAIALIQEQTGVPVRVRPGVLARAPGGADTVIRKMEVANVPLRDGLGRILAPLGLTFALRDDHVEVLTRECLRGLGRRATWEELETLDQLAASEPGIDEDAAAAIQTMIQFRVSVRQPWTLLARALRDVGAGPGDEVLTRACHNLGWTWTLAGRRIVVADAVETIRDKLSQRITLRMTNRPLLDVLQAVAEHIGVAAHTEPDLMASLPRRFQQNYSIDARDDRVEQVIDTIAAYTGIDYVIEPGGIFFFNAADDPADAAISAEPLEPGKDADPIVAKLTRTLDDGSTVDWLIRRSELPPELREMRKQDLAELFRTVRSEPPPEP